MRIRRSLERLRTDQHADVEQDWRDCYDWDYRQQQRDHAEPRQHDHHDAGRGRVDDPAAHRLPAGMADIDRVDERIAHQATDQADDTISGEHARRRIGITGGLRALDIVHGFDEVVDAERYRGHEDDAEILKAREDVINGGKRYREAEIRKRVADALQAQPAVIEAEQVGAPGDDHADGDSHETGGYALRVSETAEPAHHDDGKAGQADHRRHVHFQRRTHGDEGDGHAGQSTEQSRTGRDSANERSDEAAGHQDEALEE